MKTILYLLSAILLTGCATQKTPQRYAWITGLKPEKAEYYRQLHANPWPSVNKRIKDCHIRNFSIHEREITGFQVGLSRCDDPGPCRAGTCSAHRASSENRCVAARRPCHDLRLPLTHCYPSESSRREDSERGSDSASSSVGSTTSGIADGLPNSHGDAE